MPEFQPETVARRSLLRKAAGVGAGVVLGGLAGAMVAAPPARAAGMQAGWRYCVRCAGLFWPLGNKGCPAGGPHAAAGWTFQLPIDGYRLPNQPEWRCCMNCNALHYDGYPDPDGRCSTGIEHKRTGVDSNFALPANVGEPAGHQANWRFCLRSGAPDPGCFMLFFDGYPNFKGICPAGPGGHLAVGWNFAIPVYSYAT
ncbi:hypothetical protein Sru01_68320 [Sphaerisporangium rufum]|uniref:Uncharacterized protein n=1 Tax=Sphaerisporangium rufum TaxID=1381558 RepID=A0A919RBU2_9ACTN|nr:hypothetical protein [Sphaerisporangium rufum]GII81850.1 hypothetical protein Sru01_68320 [Sphaerisporangium rufum]